MRTDRRKFLRQTIQAALGVSLYSALGNLQLVQAATRASNYVFTDYKALVCVFLYGGNDSFNTVVPYTQANFNSFFGIGGVRPVLGVQGAAGFEINRTTLHPLNTTATSGDGIQYAMHASMPEFATLFNQASSPLAILANVGPLVQPTTQAQVIAGSVPLPPQLTSHSDQSAYWQSSPPTNNPSTGWGGKICDLVASANPAGIPIMTSLSGQDAFIRGDVVNGYVMNSTGAPNVGLPYDDKNHLQTAYDLLHAQGSQAHVMERTFAATGNHAEATATIINAALSAAGAPNFDAFFPNLNGSDLARQLKTTALLIWAAYNNVAGYSGLKRQVFYVNTGGYDTHGGQLAQQVDLLAELSVSLAGFYNALNSVGIGSGKTLASVATAFTASDFGRTMSANDDGTDHGWGGHHFIIGGAVQGGRFYGNGCAFASAPNFGTVMPSLVNPTTDYGVPSPNLNDDGDGRGATIPTTSVEQYGATLASWFGLSASDVNLIFPNLANFTTKNLGFLV